MSEKKSRGRFKQYLHNLNVKVPSNTFYRNKRETPVVDNIQNLQNFDSNFGASGSVLNINAQEQITTPLNNNQEYLIETNSIETNFDHLNENLDILSDNVNSITQNDNQPSFDFEEFNTLFDLHEISAEELASAYLVAFFNGSITQKVYSYKVCGGDF
jgi:hypothetical protein